MTAFEPARARSVTASVLENVRLSRRYFLLRLERPAALPETGPGQFVHVAVPDASRFFLRRPFSIHDAGDEFVDLLIVELGPGTQALRRLRPGETVDFYGPLGGTFPDLSGKRILALGGGVGLAPLYYYGARGPGRDNDRYRLLYGARGGDDLFLDAIDLEGKGALLATDDGSHGFHGNVVELAARELENGGADVVFSCGPTPMMRAAHALAERHRLPHYVSLENRMGCALGACRACVVPTHLDGDSPYRTVCHDGPVFLGTDLVWEALPTP